MGGRVWGGRQPIRMARRILAVAVAAVVSAAAVAAAAVATAVVVGTRVVHDKMYRRTDMFQFIDPPLPYLYSPNGFLSGNTYTRVNTMESILLCFLLR